MNFTDFQERLWSMLGQHEAGQRPDWRTQHLRDALNLKLEEVSSANPFLWELVRESTLSIVAGTSTYTLDDWCARPLQFWTEGTSAHRVAARNYRTTTRDGSRNSSASYTQPGPYEYVVYPRTTSASKSGTAGAATEGATTVTKTGGSDWTSSDIGKMLRLGGEGLDYKITAVGGVSSLTVDKAVRARLTGNGTSGTGAGYSSAVWEISPAGRCQIKILPTPTAASTVYYSFIAYPRRLINTTDVPEITDTFHHLLWKGAIAEVGAFNEDPTVYQMYKAEYEQALMELKANNREDQDVDEPPHFASQLWMDTSAYPRDVSFRGRSGW